MKQRMMKQLICLLAVVAGSVSVSRGAAIVVGHHELYSNLPNQKIQLFVTGGDAVEGLNFNLQIGDGGPDLGGLTSGPRITAVDLLTGTIFDGNNTGEQDPGSYPQLALRTTTTSTGTVSAQGLLATITIDTTGYFMGTWPLSLSDTLNGPTDFAGHSAAITNGTLQVTTVVPEPSLAMFSAAVFLLPLGRRRNRRG